jgi:thymidylate synthase (FAD)
MKLINPSVELIQQQPSLVGVYKHIERCARTCYKSEDKITDDSYMTMYNNLVQRGHLAMLEHGTVYLKDISWSHSHLEKYKTNKYSKYNEVYLDKEEIEDGNDYDVSYKYGYYVTTNLRVIIENSWEDDLKYICEPSEFHEKRITLKFTSDIQFYKDLTRHREESYAIESTRWCNYMAKKFGMSISFFHPQWLKEEDREEFENDCKFVENLYFKWKDKGWTTEQAAYFLIQGTAATVIVTGFTSGFKHIFDLRLNGTTGKPHETMLQLMGMAKEELIKNNLWNLIYPENERN